MAERCVVKDEGAGKSEVVSSHPPITRLHFLPHIFLPSNPLRHRAYFSATLRCERPRIAETGVTVQRVVRWYRLGLTPEEIADRIGHLSLTQVHAAQSYYHANRQQTDAEIVADDREAELAALNSSTGPKA